jgi:predicted transcriptional regulator
MGGTAMTIKLTSEIERRLNDQAAQRGTDPTSLALKLIDESLPSAGPAESLADLFERWERDDHTDDPEEVKRRQAEGEALMRGLARNRLEMEGPHARKLWP